MISQEKREMMREAYMLLERHENPESNDAYWDMLMQDCNAFCSRWKGQLAKFAFEIASAIVTGLEDEWKREHTAQASL